MNLDSSNSVPLWLLHENEIDVWRATQAPPVARWLAEQNFKGEKHRVLAAAGFRRRARGRGGRPGQAPGGVVAVACGGLRRTAAAPPIPSRPGVHPRRGHAVVFGVRLWRLSLRPLSSRQERCREHRGAANADVRYVTLAAESLRMARDWINTPAQDLGPAELAGAAQRLAERHQAGYREWVGEACSPPTFPRFTRSGAPAARRPGSSSCAGRREPANPIRD